MPKPRHPITPHKGGRTKKIDARIKPEVLKMIREGLEADDVSFPDWLEAKIIEEWGEIYQSNGRLDVYDPQTYQWQGVIEEPDKKVEVTEVK